MTTAVDTTKATDGRDPNSDNRPVPPGSTMVTLKIAPVSYTHLTLPTIYSV